MYIDWNSFFLFGGVYSVFVDDFKEFILFFFSKKKFLMLLKVCVKVEGVVFFGRESFF